MFKSVAFWAGVSTGAIVALGIFLSIRHWDWLNQDGDPSATIRNAGLVIAAPVALILAVWRSLVAEQQSKISEKSLINEQFKSGVELLGHKNPTVRLGAISTLNEMAELYPETLYARVMGLFETFLTYPPRFGPDQREHKKGEVDYESRDTLEIIRIINARTPEQRARYQFHLPDTAPFTFDDEDDLEINLYYQDPAK